jgi:hypothetical protein
MKRFSLSPHPAGQPPAGIAIEVAVRREPRDALEIHFRMTGDVTELCFPPRARAERVEELWRHTCFEAFIRATGDDRYLELNFSPSTEWAAYHFNSWRAGMSPALECAAPSIRFDLGGAAADLHVGLTLDWATRLRDADWQVGLAAILEDREGRKSQWALAHPPGQPDFHHADTFACELPR